MVRYWLLVVKISLFYLEYYMDENGLNWKVKDFIIEFII